MAIRRGPVDAALPNKDVAISLAIKRAPLADSIPAHFITRQRLRQSRHAPAFHVARSPGPFIPFAKLNKLTWLENTSGLLSSVFFRRQPFSAPVSYSRVADRSPTGGRKVSLLIARASALRGQANKSTISTAGLSFPSRARALLGPGSLFYERADGSPLPGPWSARGIDCARPATQRQPHLDAVAAR